MRMALIRASWLGVLLLAPAMAQGAQGGGRVLTTSDVVAIPVSLEKSLQVANEMLAAQGLADAFHLEEGSGISRDDRMTARGLAKVLALFAPHADLLHGHDGGLNKTGAMDGVRTLAGYADTSSRGRVHFVISAPGEDGEMRYRLLAAVKSEL